MKNSIQLEKFNIYIKTRSEELSAYNNIYTLCNKTIPIHIKSTYTVINSIMIAIKVKLTDCESSISPKLFHQCYLYRNDLIQNKNKLHLKHIRNIEYAPIENSIRSLDALGLKNNQIIIVEILLSSNTNNQNCGCNAHCNADDLNSNYSISQIYLFVICQQSIYFDWLHSTGVFLMVLRVAKQMFVFVLFHRFSI